MNPNTSLASKLSRSLLCTALATSLAGTGVSWAGGGENSARYLQLINCGAQNINEIKVQKKNDDMKRFRTVYKDFGLQTGQAICFDLKHVEPEFNRENRDLNSFETDDKARLRVRITWGDAVNCDSTNVDLSSDQVRVLKISGTSLNNNRCKSKTYKSKSKIGACTGAGKQKRIIC